MILAVKNDQGRTELLLLLWGQLKAGSKTGTLLLLLLPSMAANPSLSIQVFKTT